MVEFICDIIKNEYLATLIMSFVPLIELKGGIVFARGAGINFFEALGLCYIGSTLVFFPIFFLLIPILNLLKKIKWFKSFAEKVEGYFDSKAREMLEKQQENKKSGMTETLLKQIGVFVFIAIPLPMTGIWTGTAIAVFLGLKFREAILPAVLGNAVAGILISVLAEVCVRYFSLKSLDYILYALFALAIILLVFTIIKVATSKPKSEEEK